MFIDRDLDKSTCVEVYTVIFNCLADVLQQSNVRLDNESVNWIAQEYYGSLKINGKQEFDPNIFDKKAKLENIPSKELALMAMLLNGTDFSEDIILFLKRR
jgi:hypothetical protein